LVEFEYFDDVGVVELLEDIDLVQQGVDVLLAQILLTYDLHGAVLSSRFVLDLFDLTIGTLAKGL